MEFSASVTHRKDLTTICCREMSVQQLHQQPEQTQTCVRFDMTVQGGFHCKGFPTFIALVRPFPRVDSDVPMVKDNVKTWKNSLNDPPPMRKRKGADPKLLFQPFC